MKCFIAMAFSRKDTDLIYDLGIRPTLLARGIEPIRVDRLEHNDSINDRIIEEIQAANFAIVDLTYARPSVYYEAGFAERTIPVIYTIRRDHLSQIPNDEFGVFKLHFDLAMKNIIDWISGDDKAFVARLAARIDKVVEPLIVDFAKKRRQIEKSIAFSNLPVVQRKEIIIKLATEALKNQEFESRSEVEKRLGSTLYVGGYRYLLENSFFSVHGETYKFVNVTIETDMEKIPYPYIKEHPEYNLNFHHSLNHITSIEEHWLICCFHSVSFEAICHKMSEFKPEVEHQKLVQQRALEVPKLSDNFNGDIFVVRQAVYDNIIQKVWSGGNYFDGFFTKTPPPGYTVCPRRCL